MGAYAVHLAEIAASLSCPTAKKVRSDILSMADITISMIRDATTAFLEEACNLTREVQSRDDEVGGIYASFVHELMKDMSEHRTDIHYATALLFYSNYLERLADHTTNICKEVIYVCTGEKVLVLQ
jgi:phosphate transport system protein